MKNFRVITDSGADLPPKILEENFIDVVKFGYILDGKEFLSEDDTDSKKEFYETLRSKKTIETVPCKPESFIESMSPILKNGEDILYIATSSGVSDAFNNSKTAAQKLKEEFPNRNIICFDSLAVSLGVGQLVLKAVEMQKEDKSIDEIVEVLEEYKKKNHQWFIVDDVSYLYGGGRLNPMSALIGSTTHSVKPILRINEEGKVAYLSKVKGRKKALDEILNSIGLFGDNFSDKTIYITHGDCAEDLKSIVYTVKARFNPLNIITNCAGSTTGIHGGPNAMGVFFIGKEIEIF